MSTNGTRPATRRDVWLAAGAVVGLLAGGALVRDEMNRRSALREARAEWGTAFAKLAGTRAAYDGMERSGILRGEEERAEEKRLLERVEAARRKMEALGGSVSAAK